MTVYIIFISVNKEFDKSPCVGDVVGGEEDFFSDEDGCPRFLTSPQLEIFKGVFGWRV